MIAFRLPAPIIPATARASTRPGKASIISAMRMITPSTQPLKYPAVTPAAVPTRKIRATTPKVALREAPCSVNDPVKISRPILSVPKYAPGWVPPGPPSENRSGDLHRRSPPPGKYRPRMISRARIRKNVNCLMGKEEIFLFHRICSFARILGSTAP